MNQLLQEISSSLGQIQQSIDAHLGATPATGSGSASAPGSAAGAPSIRLPYDDTPSMKAFYGEPISPASTQKDLVWLNFPDEETVLYSHSGARLTDHDGDGRPDHRCHKLVRDRLEAAMHECFSVFSLYNFRQQGLHVFGGCWSYRRSTGGSRFSTHAWGAAIDINPGENPWKVNRTSFDDRVFDIFEKHGFLSGLRAWGHDAMHFQAAFPRYVAKGSYYDEHGFPEHLTKATD